MTVTAKPEDNLPAHGSSMSIQEGLSVARTSTGSVLLVDQRVSPPTWVEIPDSIWGSIIAHVSVRGEAPGEWFHAMNFHNDPTAKVFVVEHGKIKES